MRGFECFGDLAGNPRASSKESARLIARQVFALDEFHHKGLDALSLETINGCDVRMIQRGQDAASRSNRASRSASVAKESGRIFSATSRFRDVSRAR